MYRIENKLKIKKYIKIYRKKNRHKINIHEMERLKTDIDYKLRKMLRNRITAAVKNNQKSKKTMELIGCSIPFLKNRLESKFKKGMAWKNYGLYGWHIDHIIPCAHFDLSKPSQQKKCFHYKNLQPLWAEENLKKSDKIFT